MTNRRLENRTWAFVGTASAGSTSYTTPSELSLHSLTEHEFRVWANGTQGSSVSYACTEYTDYETDSCGMGEARSSRHLMA